MTDTQERLSIHKAILAESFISAPSPTSFVLGTNSQGIIQIDDLDSIVHIAVAGSPSIGKSCFVHSLLLSIISHASPQDVQLLICDTKFVEYALYSKVPHLRFSICSDLSRIQSILAWTYAETMRRLKLLSDNKHRTTKGFNAIAHENGETPLPDIVLIIDDADTIVEHAEMRDHIQHIAQKGRIAGVHLVLVTASPKSHGMASIIQGAIPARVVFDLTVKADRNVMLGTSSVPLMGVGSMLYRSPRFHGKEPVICCQIDDATINSIIAYAQKTYSLEGLSFEHMKDVPDIDTPVRFSTSVMDPDPSLDELAGDEMLPAAVDVILETHQASASMLQRRLKLSYARAAQILDEMEERGIVGPFIGTNPRQILITRDAWEQMNKTLTLDCVANHLSNDDAIILDSEDSETDFLSKYFLVDEIRTKAVGVTFCNADGSNRQKILAQCHANESLAALFYTYEGNPACALISDHGQIGNLSADLAARLKLNYPDCMINGEILEITGGGYGRNFGCNIVLRIFRRKQKSTLTDTSIQEVLRESTPAPSCTPSPTDVKKNFFEQLWGKLKTLQHK